MGLTLLAIPVLLLGIFIKPYAVEATRCLSVSLLGKSALCFEAASSMPEIIKYGCVAAGFALLYAGRMQIRRARGLD